MFHSQIIDCSATTTTTAQFNEMISYFSFSLLISFFLNIFRCFSLRAHAYTRIHDTIWWIRTRWRETPSHSRIWMCIFELIVNTSELCNDVPSTNFIYRGDPCVYSLHSNTTMPMWWWFPVPIVCCFYTMIIPFVRICVLTVCHCMLPRQWNRAGLNRLRLRDGEC